VKRNGPREDKPEKREADPRAKRTRSNCKPASRPRRERTSRILKRPGRASQPTRHSRPILDFTEGLAMSSCSKKIPIRLRLLLAAALWLSTAPAFGQTPFFPFDLPANSVIANPTGGPASASTMSFDQLRSTLMLPPAGPSAVFPNGTIWGNISPGSGMGPAGFFNISSVLDLIMGTTQGSVAYRNATGWVGLPPGVLGQLLSTGGASANPSWITANGTGTVTQVTCGTGLTGGTFATIGTCALALTNATLQANPTAGTTFSTTNIMLGLGSSCKITPIYSGRIHVEIYGFHLNNTAADTNTLSLRYGTGIVPVASVAVTGTQIGNTTQGTAAAGSYAMSFALGGIVTGLSIGTQVWIDLAGITNGGTGTVSTLSCNAMEF
jgi:hypothetical protein